MQIILIIAVILLWNFRITQACTNETLVNCTTTSISSTTRVITVYGVAPTGMCVLAQIRSKSFLYSPTSINSVWMTFPNQDSACVDNLSVVSSLSNVINSSQEIVVLQLTKEYVRLVFVPKSCTMNCSVVTPLDIENLSKSVNLKLYSIYTDINQIGPYCLNNGSIDPNYNGAGYKCICPPTAIFMGPACELMERRINSKQTFFNVFPNKTNINMRFSLFSIGITGTVNIFSIQASNFVQRIFVTVTESIVNFGIDGSGVGVNRNKIDDQQWYDFNIAVSMQKVTLTLNGNTTSRNISIAAGEDFTSYYLVLNNDNLSLPPICIKNLIVNSKIIDLNIGPSYMPCCKNRCNCNSTQDCNCRPFVSLTDPTCYCKYGYQSPNVSDRTCKENAQLQFSQMTDNVASNFAYSLTILKRLDFGFRTLSSFGTLLNIKLSSPDLSFNIQINNANIILNVSNQITEPINYNVANGFVHLVTVNFNNYSLEMILDNNANYSTILLNWFNGPFSGDVSLSSLTMGPMQKTINSSINNYTTCFSPVQFNSASTPTILNTTNNPNMSPDCSSGTKCSNTTIICPPNSVCDDSQWQNTICTCFTNYTLYNSGCIFDKCSSKPCKYGICSFNVTTNNFVCNCTNGYTGTLCDNPPVSYAGVWWIAVLIVLIVLLIILIVMLWYCFCLPRPAPFMSGIGKINENCAPYNDQAGESDYKGYPIDFNLLKNALNGTVPKVAAVARLPVPAQLIPELMSKKKELEKDNKDLVLDHPLEYGYEGDNSDIASISSIGSSSAASEVDENELDNVNLEFSAKIGF